MHRVALGCSLFAHAALWWDVSITVGRLKGGGGHMVTQACLGQVVRADTALFLTVLPSNCFIFV